MQPSHLYCFLLPSCFAFAFLFAFFFCFLYSRLERLQQWKDSKKSSSNKTTGVRRTGALSSASAASSPVLKTRDGNKKVTFDGLVEKDSPLKSPMRSRTRTTTTTKSNSTARSRSVNCYTCWYYLLCILEYRSQYKKCMVIHVGITRCVF